MTEPRPNKPNPKYTFEDVTGPSGLPPIPKLDVWDPKSKDPDQQLPEHFFLICEGARRSGKSIFLKWMLYNYKDYFDLAIVCSETPMNGFWQPLVSNQYVHQSWDPFLITKLLESQTAEREKAYHRPDYKPKKVLIILDDIIGDRAHIHEDPVLNRLAVQGRHYFVSVVLTTQEPHAIGTSLRNNCDAVVIFQQKSKRAKESVLNDFLQFKLDDKWSALYILKKYTADHSAILVFMDNLKPGIVKGYFHIPQDMTFDPHKGKDGDVKVPKYTLGSKEQKYLANTPKGALPILT